MTDLQFLQRVDLNLLKIFQAVYETRQTTAAAERLGLSQPAVSQALGRLRHLTSDPLFVPAHGGMEPTSRASELAGPVGAALGSIQRALERNPTFDPGSANRRFRLGMLDYGVMMLAPAIASAVSRDAPGISIDISHVPSDSAARLLLSDQIDLVTGPFDDVPASLECTPVFRDTYVVAARRDHPALKNGLNREALADLPHVDVTYDLTERGGLDTALRSHGIHRRKAMQVPFFAGACVIAGASDFLAIIPQRMAQAHQHMCGLKLHDLPVSIAPLKISALNHRRDSAEPGLKWLRDIIGSVADAPLPISTPALELQEH